MPISLKIEKFNLAQAGKVVKGPSEQILTFILMFYHVIACDLKISIYKVNSPYKKQV